MSQVKVKVVRPFYWQGQPLEIGAEIDVDAVQAAELAAMNKVAPVVAAEPEAQAEEPKADDAKPKKKKAD